MRKGKVIMGKFGFYERSERGAQVGTALAFLFIGLGIGALSALIFAPQSGEKTRRIIRRKYDDARDTVEDWSDQAGDMWEKGVDYAKDAKERVADKVAPMAKAALRRD
ncbi:MAG: YtxH domain-containing protein [Chthoniobacterales bacterium]